MRFSSFALPALAANLVAALPQDIDLDMVAAAADPTYTEAVGATAQVVTYNTAAAVAAATSASSVSVEVTDVLSATAVVQAKAKRSAAACAVQPSVANNAPTYSPDSAAQFAMETSFGAVASAAPTPSGYTRAFVNQQGSSQAYGYMGFDYLSSYDTAACAAKCTSIKGCVAINIYFERDPTVDPSANQADGCYNPSSVTNIKCVYWGGPVSADTATNTGQMRAGFTVAIAGSNGYITNQLPSVAGYQAPVPFGNNAINAPYDAQGYNTFMGSKIFTQSVWDANLCAQYCDSQTDYNLKTAPKDGTPAKVCKFFNTFVLTSYSKDGTVTPQGQYCSLYTEAWPIKYATNGGQWRGTDQYLVSYSFGYSKTDAGIDPTVGDSKGAAYQAWADIKWSSLQPFCSTLLGYTTPVSSVTATTSITQIVTSTVVSTIRGRGALGKRAAATTPAGLTKYQASVISSACSLAVTSPTVTVTTTVATSTVVAATSTVLATTTTARYFNAPPCQRGDDTSYGGAYNKGGCQSCFCNAAADGGAYCVDDKASLKGCYHDTDCPSDEFCNLFTDFKQGSGKQGGLCDKGASCSSTYSLAKRGFFGLMVDTPRPGRMHRRDTDLAINATGPNAIAAISLVDAGALPTSVADIISQASTAQVAAAATSSA